MKINGNPEGGQGGGLTPAQEALLNSVPNKVNQVRLVTDGSAIRHEGALEPLTFSQIYDLVMDNSKYVYIVMDNNIRFRPSAYDGDAIWFDSSFIEEGKPNILRCIINSDNRVDITQIVVASEEYVDEKVAEAGGLTPEQEEAVDTLVDASEGILYTDTFESNTGYKLSSTDYNSATRVAIIDGECLINTNYMIFKFSNGSTSLVCNKDAYTPGAIWKDKSGRYHIGIEYDVDINTGVTTHHTSQGEYFMEGATNIVVGNDAVYKFEYGQCYRYDEDSQMFVFAGDTTITGSHNFAMRRFIYDGRIIAIFSDCMYEFVESEGMMDIVMINDLFNYHTCPVNSNYQYTTFNNIPYAFGSFFNNIWKYEDGDWVNVVINDMKGDWKSDNYETVIKDGFAIIPSWDAYLNCIFLGEENMNITSWKNVGDVAVDLSSAQNISGLKTFDDIRVNSQMYLPAYMYGYSNTIRMVIQNGIQINNNSSEKSELEINIPVKLNDKVPGLRDDIILNSDATYPGNEFMPYEGSASSSMSNRNFFTTSTGRIFHSLYNYENRFCELVNGTWEPKDIFDDGFYIEDIGSYVKTTPQYTFCIMNSDVYLFNEEASKFEKILRTDFDDGGWWADGDCIRHYDSYKIYNDGGEWKQVNEPIEGLSSISYYMKSFTSDGVTYILVDQYLYQWDRASLTAQELGYFRVNCSSIIGPVVEHNGKAYFVVDGGKLAIFSTDPSAYMFTKEIDARVTDWSTAIFLYDNKITSYKYVGNRYYMGYLYNATYSKPEVPESDGTYVLKATRVGDQITYTWVAE